MGARTLKSSIVVLQMETNELGGSTSTGSEAMARRHKRSSCTKAAACGRQQNTAVSTSSGGKCARAPLHHTDESLPCCSHSSTHVLVSHCGKSSARPAAGTTTLKRTHSSSLRSVDVHVCREEKGKEMTNDLTL